MQLANRISPPTHSRAAAITSPTRSPTTTATILIGPRYPPLLADRNVIVPAMANDEHDDLAEREIRFGALSDQLGAELASYARPFGQYFHALVDEGFNRDEALELVSCAQTTWLEALLCGPDSDEDEA